MPQTVDKPTSYTAIQHMESRTSATIFDIVFQLRRLRQEQAGAFP